VYKYAAGGGFPSSTYNATNYWVDPVFALVTDTTPPVVTARAPAAGATGVAVTAVVAASFSEPVQAGTITFSVSEAGDNDETPVTITGTLTYDSATRTATFTPNAPLSAFTTYTAVVLGAQDLAGNQMAPVAWTFTTGATTYTAWPASATPAVASVADSSPVEVGAKFKTDVAGAVTGVRFYKGAANTGTHVAHLWDAAGNLLATATYTGESATGWQQANFTSPVSIQANATYVVSYYAPVGGYAATGGYFASAGADNGPLHVLSNAAAGGNGVYKYAAGGGFPSSTYNATNYWVDPVIQVGADVTPPTVTATAPAAGATGVSVGSQVVATFSEPVQPATVSFVVTGPSGAVNGTVTFDSANQTATFSPAAALATQSTYTATVSGAKDAAGNQMSPVSWSFTTQAAAVQTTVTNFAAGTFDGTSVNATGGLQLSNGFTDDFTGTQLNAAAWGATAWTTQSAVTVSSGILSVQGTQLLSVRTFVGNPVQGLINFGATPYQHFGLATGLTTVGGNSWAIFSTGGTTDTLFARVNANGATQDVNLGALPTGFHTYRIEPTVSPTLPGFKFYVDGSLKTTVTATLPAGTLLRVALSSYNSTSSPALQADSVQVDGYAASGTYVSASVDAGKSVTWDSASWVASLPAGTGIKVETMTSVDGTTFTNWAQVGSDGTIASPAGRYLRFRITFTTTDPAQTAVLSSISFFSH
jgi:hypothetical protein